LSVAVAWRVLLSALVGFAVVGGTYGVAVLSGVVERDGAFTILRFDQQVTIAADGTTEVVEDLAVRFSAARRGIFRDLDARTDFPSTGGFEVLGVDRGRPDEPWTYALEWWEGGPRVRIGEADRWLTPGDYRYRLGYRAPSWYYELAGEPGVVEVRIDSPGFDWPTDVAAASLEVTVPGAVLSAACVDGSRGTTRACARQPVVAGDTATFELGPYRDRQAATVAVWFSADAFAPSVAPATYDPPPLTASAGPGPWGIDRVPAALLLLGFLAVPLALWEVLSARRLYRDRVTDELLHDRLHPSALPVPPFGLPPAEVAGLLQRSDGEALFLAALVDLDQRGLVHASSGTEAKGLLARARQTLTLRKADVALHPSDAELVHHLVPDGATTTFDGDYDAAVADRARRVQRVLASRARSVFAVHGFLHDEGGLVARAWFRGLIALVAIAYAGLVAFAATAVTPLPAVATAGVVALVAAGWALLRALWRHHRLPLNSEGRDAVARARSFAEFVRTVEGDEIGWAAGQPGIDHHHPALSLLPYAIALGLADSWYQRFGPVMQELAATAATSAGAAWWVTQSGYRGVGASQRGTSTAPSSSGGGGGGSGGGGGGGGSW